MESNVRDGTIFVDDTRGRQPFTHSMYFLCRYELLKICRKTDGGFQVSIVGDDAGSLSRWIQRQKEKYKLYKLEPGREILLKKENFPFPERPPKEELKIDDNEHSEGLKRALAEIDNARPEDLFGDDAKRSQRHTGGSSSMVAAIIDLAGEDKDLGKQVAESIGVLSKFMSISEEELATRMSAPMDSRSRTNYSLSTNQGSTGNAFAKLLPVIVGLRESGNAAVMKDCMEFLEKMVQKSKADGVVRKQPNDADPYFSLLALAVELDQELDKSERSNAVVQSCVMYFQHILSEQGASSGGGGKVAAVQEPATKRSRLSKCSL